MNPASLYLYFSVLYLGNALIQGWLFWKTRRRLSLFFALMQIGNCYIYFYYGLFYAGFLPDFEILSGTSLMMQFANIFSSYYMIRYLLYPDDSFPRRSLLVHLPFFVTVPFMAYQLQSSDFRHLVMQRSLDRFVPDYYEDGWVRLAFIVYVGITLLALLYLASRRLKWQLIMKEVFQKGAVRDIASAAFLLVLLYALIFAGLQISQEGGYRLFASLMLVLEMTAFTAGMVLLQFLPRLLAHRFAVYEISPEAARRSYIRDRLQNVDTERLESVLTDLMERRRLYCDEDLSLRSLAMHAGVSYRQLSEYLNTSKRQSFQAYVQGYRLSHAKHLLKTRPDLNVTRIAFESGFNSLASFYRVFKKEERTNPLTFREENDSQVTT